MSAAPQLAEDLFNEHYRRIYAYCLRQLGSREEAEDAVQATYLNACRHLMEGFEPETAQAWLFKVAHNVCLTRRRSSSRRARVEKPHDLQAVQDVVARPETSVDELFGLDEALAGLPEQQRQAILLREWQGLSYREVAAKLGLTQAAVETLIFRARRSLANALEQPVRHRRRLLHSFDGSALLASLKSALAGNVSASLATAVAVAASAATLSATPITRFMDFPTHAAAVTKVEKKPSAERRTALPDRDGRSGATISSVATTSAFPMAARKRWAGANPKAGAHKSVTQGRSAERKLSHPNQPQHVQPPEHSMGGGQAKPAAPASPPIAPGQARVSSRPTTPPASGQSKRP